MGCGNVTTSAARGDGGPRHESNGSSVREIDSSEANEENEENEEHEEEDAADDSKDGASGLVLAFAASPGSFLVSRSTSSSGGG